MRKVTKKIVTLTTSSLCALALVPACVATYNAVKADNNTYVIDFVADNGVTVNVPVTARAGKVVNFSVNYDKDSYEIDGVAVNYATPGSTSDNDYYFVMPEEDATIYVYGHAITDPYEGYYAIENVQKEKGLVLVDMPTGAYAGDQVYFDVAFKKDCSYTSTGAVEVYTLDAKGDKEYVTDVENIYDDTYCFTMPEGQAYVDVKLETKGFFLEFDSRDNVSKLETSIDGQTWTTVTGNPVFVRAFDKVRATLTDTAKKTCTGIEVDGVKYTLAAGSKEVTFDMPGHDAKIKSLTEEIIREVRAITPEDGSSIWKEQTAHYDYVMRRCATSTGEYVLTTNGAVYNEYVRVYPTAKESAGDVKVKTLQYNYDLTNTYGWASATTGVDDHGTYYQFYLSYAREYYFRVSEEVTPREVTMVNTDHVTAQIVTKVNGQWTPCGNKLYDGSYVYVQFTAEAGYKVNSPKLAYKSYSTASGRNTSSNLNVEDAEHNVYKSVSSTWYSSYSDFAVEFKEVGERTVAVTGDAIATLALVVKDGTSYKAAPAGIKYYLGDTVYVKYTLLASAEDYKATGLNITAENSATVTASLDSSTENVYKFTMIDSNLSIAPGYKSMNAYKGYAFVGTFFGGNVYGSATAPSVGTSYGGVIGSDGSGTMKTGQAFEVYELAEGSTKENGFISKYKMGSTTYTMTNGGMAYGKDFIAGHYALSQNVMTCNDYLVAVRAGEGKSYSDYKMQSVTKGTYSAFQVLENGVLYKSGFIARSSGTNTYYLSDVTFEFTTGTSVSSGAAVYTVKVAGVVVGTVNAGVYTPAN